MKLKSAAVAIGIVLLSGCYHATVETGLTPSAQSIDKPWASGWIYGLVPPPTLATMQQCPGGVAKVETQLSFANQLVSFLTAGIYTPMSIKVTCAQGRGSAALPEAKSELNLREVVENAALESARIGGPVFISF